MSTITVIDSQGNSKVIELTAGLSLMELLRDEGYDEILAMCGGCCSCATCHVQISASDTAAQALPVVEEDEQMLLENEDHYDADTSRLSCQIQLAPEHAGITVRLLEA